MKKTSLAKAKMTALLIFILILAAALIFAFLRQPAVPEGYVAFVDNNYDVGFMYPDTWDARSLADEWYVFSANFDYLNGLAESSEDMEKEGWMSYQVLKDIDAESFDAYFTQSYEDCLEDGTNAAGFVPYCFNFADHAWDEIEIDGHTAYLSQDWMPIPESGEQMRRFYVDVTEQNMIISLSAMRTGLTDLERIDSVFYNATMSVSVK